MRTKSLLLILLAGFAISSCQKDNDIQEATNDKLLGTWKFIDMKADVNYSIVAGSGVDQEKIVNFYSLDATDPVGTMTFDKAGKANSNGIGYTYNTTVYSDFYVGGVLDFSFDTPLVGTMNPSSGSVPYKAVGTDSIYFESGFISFDPGTGGSGAPTATIPVGSRISWLSDTLVLSMTASNTSMQIINGTNAQVKANVNQIVKLKK